MLVTVDDDCVINVTEKTLQINLYFRWRSEIRMKPNEAADHEWIRQRKARQKNSTKDKKG